MATIINTPGGNGDGGSSAAGWVVAAVVVIVVVLIGLFVWPGYGRGSTAAAPTQVNVQIPAPVVNTTGGTGGAAPTATK